MTRYVVHSEDCPALCKEPPAYCAGINHDHACPPCSGAGMVAVDADELKRLVDAAETLRRDIQERFADNQPIRLGFANGLDAALQPFRAAEEK